MSTLSLIDATSSSLTVSWPAVKESKNYILQYRKGNASDDEFETLSSTLTTTQARKNNLLYDQHGYVFRVKGVIGESDTTNSDWMTHQEPFLLLSKDQMKAPHVSPAGNHALKVSWESHKDAATYELQMRANEGGAAWSTIAPSLSATEVRKKNLTSKLGYSFRVRPSADNQNEYAFSPPSPVVVAVGLSEGIKRLFRGLENNSLVKNPNLTPVKLEDALGGKEFVLLYASAHWCPPCRQFTPMLANWYNINNKNNVEVVFLSCDHDEKGFEQYFAASHPWLAVNFDDDVRENLLAHIRVSGIPRLVVLDGKTGRIIEDNAVGKQLDVNRWRQMAASK